VTAASIEIDQRVDITQRESETPALIELFALSGPIHVTKGVTAKPTGPQSTSDICLMAAGDISIEAPIWARGGMVAGSFPFVSITADGDITLDRVTLGSNRDGGELDVNAGGSLTLRGDVSVPGNAPSSGGLVNLFPGTGVLRIARKINVSCHSGDRNQCSGGSISIFPGCYADLTGAKLAATPGGFIEGCSCVHATGNVCDGGCAGLDQARINPPLGPLPICSP
jgi:hypothetical protein